MAHDRNNWFDELEPPPGGAEKLRRRIEAGGRPRAVLAPRIALAGMGAAAFVLVIALIALVGGGGVGGGSGERAAVAEVYEAAEFDRLLGRPIEETELVVTVDEQAVPVAQEEGSNPKIRIYRMD